MFGLLNLNKPPGFTSRDAVNRVQRLIRPIKVGHAGTLDPLATGVLVLCLGSATRLIEHVQRMPKRYLATFLLGQRSESDDTELPVEMLVDAPIPSREQIEAALPPFLGEIQQVPPVYSAIKIKGKKSYDLARAGKPPELAARSVTIYAIKIIRYEYPELVLDIRCGSGTYVRSLGRDLANALGSAAVMSALERTEIGEFRSDDGLDPRKLTDELLAEALLSPNLAVAELPRIDLTPDELQEVCFGRLISREVLATSGEPIRPEEVAAFDADGKLVALLSPRNENEWRPFRNFVAKN